MTAKSPDEILAEFDEHYQWLEWEHSCCFNKNEEMAKLRTSMASLIRWAVQNGTPFKGVTHFNGDYTPERAFDKALGVCSENLLALADSIEAK